MHLMGVWLEGLMDTCFVREIPPTNSYLRVEFSIYDFCVCKQSLGPDAFYTTIKKKSDILMTGNTNLMQITQILRNI